MSQKRIAVVPVITKSNKHKVCLVTSRCKRKWIVPTGKHEKRLSNRKVAAIEAFEEAGLLGKIDKKFCKIIDIASPSGRKSRKTTLYLIRVEKQLKSWPEKKQRRRILVNPGQLDKYLSDKKLKKAIHAHFIN